MTVRITIERPSYASFGAFIDVREFATAARARAWFIRHSGVFDMPSFTARWDVLAEATPIATEMERTWGTPVTVYGAIEPVE